jgi:hypothetical protein
MRSEGGGKRKGGLMEGRKEADEAVLREPVSADEAVQRRSTEGASVHR